MKKVWIVVAILLPFHAMIQSFADGGDVDPLVDVVVNIEIKRIRTIDIDLNSPPTIKVDIEVNGEKWEKEAIGYDIWNFGIAQFNIPDDMEEIEISIKAYKNGGIADISNESYDLHITYNLLTGSWQGDDWLGDANGYGHASGTEDGVYDENDCELWFDISYNDYDGDGLTYWEEVNIYHTDPMLSDAGIDYDGDGVPIEWEDKYGYDPFVYEEHSKLDVDRDGLQNVEEWQMQKWLADPFRQDIYVEIDFMEEHNGIKPIMPEESLQLQYSAFTKHNIMFLADNGIMGGSDIIPYENLDWDKMKELYNKYFLKNSSRKGVFHYSVIIHSFRGFGRGVAGFNFKRDAFAVCSAYIQKWRPWRKGMIIAHGGAYMHELGHQLGLPHLRVFPWQILYWLSWNYKSCMNYRYTFKIVDYSDGSHGFMDRDEWGNLDLQRFER